mmetsp:Transcript_17679/g.39972  ORF Transcript_17679/g.39972 Transcript_17679/m.39972 type:complete len:208 (-) Transcript_17679:737-1360(-)
MVSVSDSLSCCPFKGFARSRRAAAFISSAEMALLRLLICEFSCSVSSFIFAFVVSSLCLSSSSCSSVSCEFWMRKRFRSSSPAKMSSSCCGRVKYMGTSHARPSSGSHVSSSASSTFLSIAFCSFHSWYSTSFCCSTLASGRLPLTLLSASISAAKSSSALLSSAARSAFLSAFRFCRISSFSTSCCSSSSLMYSCGVRSSRNFLYA